MATDQKFWKIIMRIGVLYAQHIHYTYVVYTTEFVSLLLYNANENEILMWNVEC